MVRMVLRVPRWRARSGGETDGGRCVNGYESFKLVPNSKEVRLGIRVIGVE